MFKMFGPFRLKVFCLTLELLNYFEPQKTYSGYCGHGYTSKTNYECKLILRFTASIYRVLGKNCLLVITLVLALLVGSIL